MDNFRIDVTAEGDDRLRAVLALFDHDTVVGYQADGRRRLVFYWTDSEKATALPFPMTMEQAADFAIGWLEHADYGDEPDHDGSNGKGWRIYNEDWGHVDGDWSAFVAIEPAWAMYGK